MHHVHVEKAIKFSTTNDSLYGLNEKLLYCFVPQM